MIKFINKDAYGKEIREMIDDFEKISEFHGTEQEKELIESVDLLITAVDNTCDLAKNTDSMNLKARINLTLTLVGAMISQTTDEFCSNTQDDIPDLIDAIKVLDDLLKSIKKGE